MRRAYTLLLYLLIPVILFYLLWRGWRSPGYWRRWPERFGWIPSSCREALALNAPLWIHAVSVGEVQAATVLVRALRSRYPEHRILVTTTTPTGSERVRANFGDNVIHCYAPYDLPGPVQRFLEATRPQLAIIMETEIWPNTLYYCERLGIPVILVNARLSEQSARGYRRMQSLTTTTVSRFTAIAAQTQQDAQRFISLGAVPAHVHVTGTIKFDIKLTASLREAAAVLRRAWGVDRAIWIAASTHEGEEKSVLDAFDIVRQALPSSLLVIVPRHPERFAKVDALCHKRGYSTVLRSRQISCQPTTDIFVGDSMGELTLFYAAADVAFVGGSLIPTGGHNLLEPAALGLTVITGPHMFNFEETTRMLREAGALIQIGDELQLGAAVITYLQDANLRYAAGEKGRLLVEHNRGALQQVLEIIAGQVR